jgi:prepilin-type N-terminal cleavage/methylation domain-containing protein
MKKRAFTLIELLVVIAIIAILAAILFPVFAQAKLAAKKTVSLSSLKQFGLAEKMYETDYDDSVVISQFCAVLNDGTTLQTWENELYPYIKNGENVTDKKYGTGNGSPDRDIAQGIWADPGAPDHQSFPYGIHRALAPDNWGATCAAPGNGSVIGASSATAIPSPADTIFIMTKGRTETISGDPTNQWGWIYFITDEYAWASSVSPDTSGNPTNDNDKLAELNGDCDGQNAAGQVWAGCGMLPRYRYTRTCPVTFTDGHAKTMAKGSMKWFKNIWVPGLASDQGSVW